jgi:hypothetical protein
VIVDRSQQAGSYVIRVRGTLDAHWARWFDGLTLSAGEAETIISGPIRDLAELHGLLTKIHDLGLPLLEVRRVVEDDTAEERRSR